MKRLQGIKTAIFVMPRSSGAWLGAEAVWITTAGWAAAAKKKFGNSDVVCIDRIASPEEAVSFPLVKSTRKFQGELKFGSSFFPRFAKIFLDDIHTWFTHRNWKIFEELEIEGREVAFIWEKHDLFAGKGRKLADKLKVPYISYVHAPVIWEASKWGVERYFWGRFLERREAEDLKKADLVLVVSEEVKRKVLEMGVLEAKVLISPMAVDPVLFEIDQTHKGGLEEKYNLSNKVVIGWTGSFRSFHGLEQVVEAFALVAQVHSEVVLMLIGDGSERPAIQDLIKRLKITERVIFVGRKPFPEIPTYLALFDLAIVSARKAEGFHYSPLKLREYLASGVAVLAPDAGEIPNVFEENYHLKLFEAGNVQSLKKGIEYYLENPARRLEIATQGKDYILKTGTWSVELEKSLERINEMKKYEKGTDNSR